MANENYLPQVPQVFEHEKFGKIRTFIISA